MGFQNVRLPNNKVEDVIESIQDYKMYVMFMAETWHDPESISISKLRSWGLVVFKKARPRLPESVNTVHQPWRSGSGFQLHVSRNAIKVNFNCQF